MKLLLLSIFCRFATTVDAQLIAQTDKEKRNKMKSVAREICKQYITDGNALAAALQEI